VETEFPTEEEDASSVVGEVAETTRRSLETLDFGVQPFGHRIGNAVLVISQQMLQVALEQVRHFYDWRELTATDPAKPVFEEPPRPAHFLIFPEFGEQFLA
jgi:hypothetical protein